MPFIPPIPHTHARTHTRTCTHMHTHTTHTHNTHVYTHTSNSRSELKRQESELHGETLDAELELFEQELMEGGDVMLDSRTDDDLMLEMEEFL